MATRKGTKKHQLRFIGLEPDEAPPSVVVLTLGTNGKVLHRSVVDGKGLFEPPLAHLESAHRVLVGPAEADPSELEAFAQYRPETFRKLLANDLRVAKAQWETWLLFIACASGSVWRCRRSRWWYEDLVALSNPVREVADVVRGPSVTRLPAARSLAELIAWPVRCHEVCNGVVEVWRRTCCCEPWIIYDPRLKDLLKELEVIVEAPEIPDFPPPPPPPPGPQPDPEAFATDVRLPYIREGSINEMAVYAREDLQQLRRLEAAEVPEYINARRYLRCRFYSCGTPVKVGEGEINPDGRFNVCWRDLPRILRHGCHDEYAYKVRQRFGIFWINIYNGLATNTWLDAGQDATLRSYHPWAFACRPPGEPGTGAFVYLDLIGDTSSHDLGTPIPQAWDRVFTPGAAGGTLFPTPTPHGHERNLGGTLKLNYMFSEDLKLLGAKYYRISISEADSDGDPVGQRHHLNTVPTWRKAVPTSTGVDIVPVSLGPNSVGTQHSLYEIPFDLPLGQGEWEAGQYHANLNTLDSLWSDPTVRHLVTIEIFDGTGKRLRPNGTVATGQPGTEGTAAFTYRRKTAATGPTSNVPHGALTQLFWWDNRDLEAEILQLKKDGLASSEECQFLIGTANSQFSIVYRAYHPEELFQHHHSISWKRGLSGGTGTLLPATSANVGQPPAPPGTSPSADFGDMLEILADPTRTRCAFTVFLNIRGERTDGDDYGRPHLQDSAAFALEIG